MSICKNCIVHLMMVFRKLIKTDNLFFRTPDGATMYITHFAGVAIKSLSPVCCLCLIITISVKANKTEQDRATQKIYTDISLSCEHMFYFSLA